MPASQESSVRSAEEETETVGVIVGRGGWVEVRGLAGVGAHVRVRAGFPAGRIVVEELHLERAGGLTGAVLASVPVNRVEAMLNSPALAERVRTRIGEPTEGIQWDQLVPEPPRGVPVEPLALGEEHEGEHAQIVVEFPNGTVLATFVRRLGRRDLRLRSVPSSRGKRPDAFYREVAETFSAAAASGPRPAVRIAEANKVPVTTVHRWVKEARRRGLLAGGAPRNREEQR